MKKTLRFLLFGLMVMLAGVAMAENKVVAFDANTDKGAFDAQNGNTGADKVEKDGVAISITNGALGAGQYRVYKGEKFTVASSVGNITKIDIVCTETGTKKQGPGCFSEPTSGDYTFEEAGKNGSWTGDAAEVTLTAASNQVRMTSVVVTIGDGGGQEVVVEKELYAQDFTAGQGLFTIDNVMLAEGLTLVWEQTSQYGMKASAFRDKVNHASESWFVSPQLDFAKLDGEASLRIDQCISSHFADVATEATLWVKENGGEWKQIVITYPTLAEGKAYSSFEVATVDLQPYKGKKVQFGFKYTSTAEAAGTWEIKSFAVVGTGEVGVDGGQQPVAEVKKAASIKELQAMADNDIVELTLTNAQVLYVNEYNKTKELFVRDATGAADLYELGIDAQAGQLLNGTITGKRGKRSGFGFALLKSEQTNAATLTVGPATDVQPRDIGLDEAASYYCDLVVFKGVAYKDKKAVGGEDQVPLYDRFQLGLLDKLKDDGTLYDLTGLMYDGGNSYGPELVITAATLAGGGEIKEDTVVVELVGDGSQQNPYLVSDLKQLSANKLDDFKDSVWVKGIVVGALNNSNNLVDTVVTNLALAAQAGATQFDEVVPVQLPNNAVRAALNVKDNPSLIGKEVMLFGKIEKYFTVVGLKGVSNYIVDGQEAGVKSVAARAAKSNAVFTLSGQRVTTLRKGLYITEGRKVLVK